MGQDSRRKKTMRRKQRWYLDAHYDELRAERVKRNEERNAATKWTRVFRLVDVPTPKVAQGFDGRPSASQRAVGMSWLP
jgi:hypothetical protein